MPLGRVLVLFVAVAAFASASAGEGQIPLYQPTTITESGHYVVTNDFEAASGPALRIEALDVTIDLSGHTVRGDVVTAPTAGEHHLWVRDGRIVGMLAKSFTAQSASRGPGARSPVDPMALRVTRVTGLAGGINFDPCVAFDLRDSRIDGSVSIIGNVGSVRAHVVDNEIGGSAWFGDFNDSVIRGNAFHADLTMSNGDLGSADNLIQSNVVGGTLAFPDSPAPGSTRNVARDNLVGALVVATDDNQITGNSVRKGTITVNGSKNVIDGNAVQGPAFGLVLNGGNNVYRNNVLHNNVAGPVQDNGTGNVDAGGNVN